MAGRKTLETLSAADAIVDALDVARHERERIDAHVESRARKAASGEEGREKAAAAAGRRTMVREAAVATLRECGDAWAAAALLSWSKRHRRDRVVASAARLVAARLQDRHGALPAPAEGALTLLEDSNTCGGELSIPAADIGAVSLPPR